MKRYIKVSILGIMLIFSIASLSWADEYNSRQAGQPWKVIAYILTPIGVTLDYLVARPLHRFLHLKTVDKLTGHSQFTEEKKYREANY